MYVLNLHFNPLLDDANIERLIHALKFVYPNITFKDGTEIDTIKSKTQLKKSATVSVYKPNRDDVDLVIFDNYIRGGRYGLPNPINGYEWIDEQIAKQKNEESGFDETINLFDSLNEARKSKPKKYKPKLNLFFDPPITTAEEMQLILGVLNMVYPGLKWIHSGPVTNFNPLHNFDNSIWFLTIGFFSDNPNKLTHTDGEKDGAIYSHEFCGYSWEDGRLWIKNYLSDTNELFNQLDAEHKTFFTKLDLTESHIPINKLQNNNPFVIKFNPPIEPENWHNVAQLIRVIFPNLVWRKHGKNIAITDYNPYVGVDRYDKYEKLAYIYVAPTDSEGFRRVTWDNLGNTPFKDDGPIINGWALIATNEPYDLFDQIKESKDGEWFNDVVKPYINMDIEKGEWEVIDNEFYYPFNMTLWYYFNIGNIRERIDKVALDIGIDKSEYDLTSEKELDKYIDQIYKLDQFNFFNAVPKNIISNLYKGYGLQNGDVCVKFKGEWDYKNDWSRWPIYHMMRLSDKAHFVIEKPGVKKKKSRINENMNQYKSENENEKLNLGKIAITFNKGISIDDVELVLKIFKNKGYNVSWSDREKKEFLYYVNDANYIKGGLPYMRVVLGTLKYGSSNAFIDNVKNNYDDSNIINYYDFIQMITGFDTYDLFNSLNDT